MAPEFTLHYGQSRLLNDRTKDEHAIIAGYGYGKTSFLPRWHMKRCVDNAKSSESIVVAPNYRLLKNRCLVEFRLFLASIGMREGKKADYQVSESPSDMKISLWWGHKILFLSGNTPENLVSYNASHISIDEPALMEEEMVSRVVARLRCPSANYRQMLFTGTPEGLNWFYERFHPDKVKRQPDGPYSESADRLVLHGASHANPYLDEKYLRKLEEEYKWDYPLYANYVLGEWVSLTRDRFYFAFDESKHVGEHLPQVTTPMLYLSFDNNVGHMAWAALQPKGKGLAVVKANEADADNVIVACEQFMRAFPPQTWGDHRVTVYGDAALWERSPLLFSTGFDSIRALLRPHYRRLEIQAPRDNPLIHDRSLCTNQFFGNDRLVIDRNCRKVILSARTVQTDLYGKVKKPKGDDVTHSMEAVDRVLMAVDPPLVTRRAAA